MNLKNVFFTLLIVMSVNATGQNFNLSGTAGYVNLDINFKVDGQKEDQGYFKKGGFFVGVQSEFDINDTFKLQPELLYASNDSGDTLYLNALGKYEVVENLSVLFGPAFNYALEKVYRTYRKFGIFGTLGASYNITPKLWTQAKYNLQLNNFYKGSADVSSKINVLLLGIGYKFM